MTEGIPTLTVAGSIATIQLNRPAVHNRMEPEDLAEFSTLLGAVEADPALRVLVVTATSKSFSSGFNIGKMDGQQGRGGVGSFEELTDRLERLTLPTVAALNGSVYGGSTDLALACDFRIGVLGMVLVMPAAKLGLHYYEGGLRRYVARLGMKRCLNDIARCEADPAMIAANVAHSQASADLREGQAAWLEKRKPRFTGR